MIEVSRIKAGDIAAIVELAEAASEIHPVLGPMDALLPYNINAVLEMAVSQEEGFESFVVRENEQPIAYKLLFLSRAMFHDVKSVHELAFYTSKPLKFSVHRQLDQLVDDWAVTQGADFVVAGAYSGTKVGVLYERLGFNKTEETYTRKVKK